MRFVKSRCVKLVMMNAKNLVLILSMASLASCGQYVSSSDFSSSSIPSSSEETFTASEFTFDGDLDAKFTFVMEEQSSDAEIALEGIHADIVNNYPSERIGDFLDPTFYEIADIYGRVTLDTLRISAYRGHLEMHYRYPDVQFDFYSHEGSLYLDFSKLDLSDVGIEAAKYSVADAYSFLKDDNIMTLGELLSSVSFDMNLLLGAAEDSPVLDEAITLRRVDDTSMCIDFGLSNATLAAFVHYFVGVGSAEEIETTIGEAVTIDEKSMLSIFFNAESESMESFSFDIMVSPILKPVQYDDIVIGENNSLVIDVRGDMKTVPCKAFDLPSFDDYRPFEINVPSEEQTSQESS